MTLKLDGATSVAADQLACGQFPMRIVAPDHAPVPESTPWVQSDESIRWTPSIQTIRERIAVAAYFLAQARSFAPGHDVEDWLLAQAKIDASDAAGFVP